MADNYAFAPSGTSTAASDNIGGVHYPRVKGTWGPDDTATDIDVGVAALPIQDGGNSITVDATSLPLPTGASTAAKQPSLGTAGTASANVITVQGIASMTALVVDGSASTQPISGTVTAIQGTAANLNATVTGTVTVTQGTASSLKTQATGAGTAGSADTGVQTIQGIASMTPVQVSQATAATLNATVVGSGSAGSAATGVLSVQGIASMTPVQVSQATASNLNAQAVGVAAEDAVLSGNPVRMANRASRARPTAMSADGDVITPWCDRYGAQVVTYPFATVLAGQATGSGDTSIISAPSSGSRIRIFRVELSNSHASTALTVGLKSTSVNSGSVFGKRYLPAVGGAAVTAGVVVICGDAEALSINLSAAGQIEWTVYYDLVAT